MTSLDPFVRDGHLIPSAMPPYAQPLPSRFAELGAREGGKLVGPYLPAVVRVRPPLASPTPLSVPTVVPPRYAFDERTAPPAYPTPAYFTPLYSAPQADAADEPVAGPTVRLFDVVPLDAPVPRPADAPALPWIDSFLANTPALPMPSIEEPFVPTGASLPNLAGPTLSDDWALNDSVVQLRDLARELMAQDRVPYNGPALAPPIATRSVADGLARWGDDDFILVEADAVRPAPVDGAEAAARALEVLAGRVRDGEISLAGYGPQLGDAAVLAAALAALLGGRR